MKLARGGRLAVGLLCGCLFSWQAAAQDTSESEPDASESSDDIGGTEADSSDDLLGEDEPLADEPEADSQPEPSAEEPPPPAEAEVSASAGVNLDVSAAAKGPTVDGSAQVDSDGEAASADGEEDSFGHITATHLRRPRLKYEGAFISDGPFRTDIGGQDSLIAARRMTGIAVPDTSAALGLGAPGTIVMFRRQIRQQPTLFLINGRRMVQAPFADRLAQDYVDLNQIPIELISKVETSAGNVAGLYGDGAIGGVVNFVTKRDYEGVEVNVGAQATDKFDQHEADVSLVLGAGSEKTGMNMMVSYFNRQPLAASDRDWMAERLERHESITSFPLSYQPLINFVQYPFADPGCATATQAGDATGEELRIPLFGEPITRSGGNALDLLPVDTTMDPPLDYKAKYLNNFDSARGNGNGILESGETSSYCGNNVSRFQDLILKEERLQSYATFWHQFSNYMEGFAEIGYFRNTNENRTAPSFPITRTTADTLGLNPVLLNSDPAEFAHADIPLNYRGFAVADDVPMNARTPNSFYLIGSPIPTHAGSNVNERRIDTLRAVTGLKGDLAAVSPNSVLATWDWELAGMYSVSEAVSRVPDVLFDNLGDALNSCPKMKDEIIGGQSTGNLVPTTIKDRQEMGCFNPFYSSVTNNVAVDPLNQSNGTVPNDRGFIDTDSDMYGADGFGLQDGGYICDPNDPDGPACPAAFDPNGDGVYELAGTPNTKQVIDRIMGEHITQERRSLATIDLVLGGDVVQFDGGSVSFGVGGQFRRETLLVNYDAAYNQHRYAFLFGGPDVDPVGRNIGAGFGEARARLLDGVVEVQAAGRVEHYENTGTAFNPMAGLAVRPLAQAKGSPLEWLLVRGHAGIGHRAPSLFQQYGSYTEFHSAEYGAALHFLPHQVQGNQNLDFEKYTTLSGGLQWDFKGIHVGGDFWVTQGRDIIGADNVQTLLRDCEAIYFAESEDCREIQFGDLRSLNSVQSLFDNLAEVDTNGVDGSISYTLDTKRRGLGDIGTFFVGVQGRYLNSYLIRSPRALREYYRDNAGVPVLEANGKLNYAGLSAEYEAAGYRNLENFAPALPKLRLAVPIRWSYGGHTIGATMRYIGSYFDDSESTIEKYGLATTLSAGRAAGTIAYEDGEEISSWTVFDAAYDFVFGDEGWQTQISVGVINLLDAAPPAADGPLGYDIGIHDPRGRILYARATGKF